MRGCFIERVAAILAKYFPLKLEHVAVDKIRYFLNVLHVLELLNSVFKFIYPQQTHSKFKAYCSLQSLLFFSFFSRTMKKIQEKTTKCYLNIFHTHLIMFLKNTRWSFLGGCSPYYIT